MSLTVASFAITAVLCFGIYCITTWYWRRRHLYKMASKFEGPSGLPLIGNAHLLIGNSEQLLSTLWDLCDCYPSLSRVWFGPVLIFCATDPEHIMTICVNQKTLEKGKIFTDCSRRGIGDGILTAPVKKWKVHRKLIQPTFHTKVLDCFVAIFSAQSKILTEQMESNLDGLEFEIFDLVSRCILDIICGTSMGVKMEAQTDRNCYVGEALHETFAGVGKRIFSPWMYPDFIFNHTQAGKDVEKYIKYLQEFTGNVIELKKKQLLERHSPPVTADDEYPECEWTSGRKRFLDHLIALSSDGASLSDEEIREEVNTMFAAGNDASALTGSYVMLMLASHPDVQEKVYRELLDIYGEDDIGEHPVTPKDLPRMKFLERVIKETLRLFPAVPFIVREVTDDLKIGEDILPKGSTLALGILSLHRNEKYWPDPLKFDPDRFLPEEIAKRHPYAYMAFSGGPRNCIGYNYALMLMKTLFGTVLRKFILKKDNVVPVKDTRLKMEITLRTVDPIKIRIERRIKLFKAHLGLWIIILPNRVDGLERVQNNLHQVNLTESLQRAYVNNVRLHLPKLRIETTLDLEGTLVKMRMTDMFENEAHFSGIADVPLKVSKIVQKAFIKVNKKGSKAAAVSGVIIETRSGRRGLETIVHFEVDRPALYIIRHTAIGRTLFSGLLIDP